MKTAQTVYELPARPAVYAMYERAPNGTTGDLVYIGSTSDLKARMKQHIISRNSSITTGSAVLSLNPDRLAMVRWWTHDRFRSRVSRLAAELIAASMLGPAYVSRANADRNAREMASNGGFQAEMTTLFQSSPSGQLQILTLDDALRRIEGLEQAIMLLTRRLDKLEE